MFFGHCRAQQPGIAAGAPEVAIDNAFGFVAIEVRDQFAFEEFADGVAESDVVFVIRSACGGIEHD
jgi:hypothetical protein